MEEKELFDSQNKVGGGVENSLLEKGISTVQESDKPIDHPRTLSFVLGSGDDF